MSSAADIPEVDVIEAARLLSTGAVMVDVREPAEWEAGRVAGAVHVPVGQLANRRVEIEGDAVLLMMCRSGVRSAEATRALTSAGYEAYNIAGGMKAWVAAGQPIEPEAGFVA